MQLLCGKEESALKRRILLLILCCALMLSLSVTASADSAASYVQVYATVTSDGNCEVTMTVSLRLEEPMEDVTFPLPKEATNIKRDGDNARTRHTGNAIAVSLPHLDNFVGDAVIRFNYSLPNVVTVSEKQLYLNLPLLSGFHYPIESTKFDVLLPAKITSRPTFFSTYHQDSIETMLQFSIDESMLTGTINSRLKDNETLSFTLPVTPAMFPSVSTYERTGNPEVVPMGILAALALLYWLVFLRCLPFIRARRTTPPEGITAGELGTRLTLAGADLTMMVVTWAQLGYIMIHLDDNGRVMLHKRMDMGNERSAFENKVFNALFGKRRVIDGTGYQYAQLCRKVAQSIPGQKSLCHPRSGNTKIFRWLACGSHVFCGICLAMNMATSFALQIILSIFLTVFAAVSAWYIQEGMYRLHMRYKVPLFVSLILSIAWILLGIFAGQWIIALLSTLGQLLAGIAAAYGGRRTDLGRQNASYVLGLRHYLKKISQQDITRLQHNDPEFFYNMLPYAMALGVGKAFSRTFGRKKLEPCPYFVCGINTGMSALDWARFLHEAIEILDTRQRRMEFEKYAAIRIKL